MSPSSLQLGPCDGAVHAQKHLAAGFHLGGLGRARGNGAADDKLAFNAICNEPDSEGQLAAVVWNGANGFNAGHGVAQ